MTIALVVSICVNVVLLFCVAFLLRRYFSDKVIIHVLKESQQNLKKQLENYYEENKDNKEALDKMKSMTDDEAREYFKKVIEENNKNAEKQNGNKKGWFNK